MNLPWEMNKYEFTTFISCTLCAFTSIFVMLMMASVFKIVTNELSVSYLDAIWVAESTVMSTIIFSIITIDICDKFGKKKTVIIGMLIIIASSLLAMISKSFALIIISRMVCGAGISLVMSANVSILADVTKKQYMPEVMSFNHAATSIGGACGPILGLAVANTFGINALFLLTIPLCIIPILLLIRTENVIVNPEKKINYPLHILFIISSALILIGAIASGVQFKIILLVGLGLMLVMIFVHKRSKSKIFDIRIFKNKTFALATAIGILFSISMYSMDNVITYYLQLVDTDLPFLGIAVISTITLASIIRGLKPLIQVFASPTIARICRGKDPNRLSIYGFILILATFVLSITVSTAHIKELIAPTYLIIGVLLAFANSIFKPMNKSVLVSCVTKEERNAAASVTSIMDNFGKVAGVFVIVNILAYYGGASNEALSICINAVLIMVLALTIAGTYLCIKRTRSNKNNQAA